MVIPQTGKVIVSPLIPLRHLAQHRVPGSLHSEASSDLFLESALAASSQPVAALSSQWPAPQNHSFSPHFFSFFLWKNQFLVDFCLSRETSTISKDMFSRAECSV